MLRRTLDVVQARCGMVRADLSIGELANWPRHNQDGRPTSNERTLHQMVHLVAQPRIWSVCVWKVRRTATGSLPNVVWTLLSKQGFWVGRVRERLYRCRQINGLLPGCHRPGKFLQKVDSSSRSNAYT